MKILTTNLISMRQRNLYLITVVEGRCDDDKHEITYVAEKLKDGSIEVIGELYENN